MSISTALWKRSMTNANIISVSAKELMRKIKGSCEQLMDECILVPLFQNKSLCETFHIKMSLIIMKLICRLVQIIWMVSHLDSFWHRVKMLINGLLDECRNRSWVRRKKYRKIKIFWSNVMQGFRCLNMVGYWHPLGGWIRSLVKSF